MQEVPDDPAERAALLKSIRPDDAAAHHDLLRRLLATEAEDRRVNGSNDHYENLYHCAYLLFRVGDVRDVPTMWSAKHIDFDTSCGFDIQFLLGAGAEETLAYLRRSGHDEVANKLARYDELGDDLTEWSEFRERYFYPS